jgi:hypothetical protein
LLGSLSISIPPGEAGAEVARSEESTLVGRRCQLREHGTAAV